MQAEPLPITLLSLARAAKLMGINPVYFAGGVGPSAAYPFTNNRCNDIWHRYSWQYADSVSQYDFALEIQRAEWDLANALGWYPAPTWISQDGPKMSSRYYRRDAYRARNINVRGMSTSVKTTFAKVISPGRRAAALVAAATVAAGTMTYSDEDGDGFTDTLTIVLPTTLTDAREIKAFFTDTGANPAWEIRPARSVVISGGNVTLIFDPWLFIDPDKMAAPPTADGPLALDLSTNVNYVVSADVYRIYNDPTQASAEFQWEPEPGTCGSSVDGIFGASGTPGQLTTQTGVFHIRNAVLGVVVPTPATYSATDGVWARTTYSEAREPDAVKLWYYAGELGSNYLGSNVDNPLSEMWARTILQIAVSRLERPICQCGNLTALVQMWQANTALQSNGFNVTQSDLDNPFGVHYGEIMAWRTVNRQRQIIQRGGTV